MGHNDALLPWGEVRRKALNNGDGRLRCPRLPRRPRAHAWRAAPEGLSGKVRCLSRPVGSRNDNGDGPP